uniref:ARAD1D19470p n=1 Tax=Blastobotrys adeninivorans TaxID=409370 RepID=A0A060TF22_BLAAD
MYSYAFVLGLSIGYVLHRCKPNPSGLEDAFEDFTLAIQQTCPSQSRTTLVLTTIITLACFYSVLSIRRAAQSRVHALTQSVEKLSLALTYLDDQVMDLKKSIDGRERMIQGAVDQLRNDTSRESENFCQAVKLRFDDVWTHLFQVSDRLSRIPQLAQPMYDFYPPPMTQLQSKNSDVYKPNFTRHKRSNILRTEHGVYDIGTREGHQRWMESIRKLLNKEPASHSPKDTNYKNPFAIGTDGSHGPNTGPNTNNTIVGTTVGTTVGTNVGSNGPQIQVQEKTSFSYTHGTQLGAKLEAIPSSASTSAQPGDERPPVQLTSSEIRAKLEEGERKQYRRLFIPGRGWMSTKRLQEEARMLELAECANKTANKNAIENVYLTGTTDVSNEANEDRKDNEDNDKGEDDENKNEGVNANANENDNERKAKPITST